MTKRILEFQINNQTFGFHLDLIKEVIANNQSFTKIPNCPKHIEGLIKLRDQVITVIDLKQKLNLHSNNRGTTILIIDSNNKQIGLVVDDVLKVTDTNESDIHDLSNLTFINNDYIDGIVKSSSNSKETILLNYKKIFDLF